MSSQRLTGKILSPKMLSGKQKASLYLSAALALLVIAGYVVRNATRVIHYPPVKNGDSDFTAAYSQTDYDGSMIGLAMVFTLIALPLLVIGINRLLPQTAHKNSGGFDGTTAG